MSIAYDYAHETTPPIAASKPKLLLIDGQRVPSVSGHTFKTLNPATEQVIATIAEGNEADVDRAVAAARRAFEGPWSTDARRRARPHPVPPGRADEAACRRDRRPRKSRCRQADLGRAAPGSAGGDRYADLLRRLGRQDQRRNRLHPRRRLHLYGARARWRGRGDRAVEFPADDRDVEAGAGPGLRLHHRDEAGRADLLVGVADRRTGAGGGPAARRAQHRDRSRPRRRRRAGQSPRCRQGDLHGIAGRRPRHPARRCRQFQTRLARARRQVRQRDLRRRRCRSRQQGGRLRHLLQCRAGLFGGLARAGA